MIETIALSNGATEPTAQPYDPIPDLGRLLCAAQRQGHPLPGLEFILSHLMRGLDLPTLARTDEAEAAIRKALASVSTATETTGETTCP